MYCAFRKHIHVYYDGREIGSERSKDVSQNIKEEEVKAKKFSESLVKALESEQNLEKWKGVYEEWNKAIQDQLGPKFAGSRFAVHMSTLRQHLFTKEQTIKPQAREELKIFIKTFQLSKETGPSPEARKFIEKNPIKQFKDTVFNQAVLHPIGTKLGILPSEYKTLKASVIKLSKELPQEYIVVIQTAENIMSSSEFGKNTGNIETSIRTLFGQGKTIDEFQRNMRKFLDMATDQKRALTMAEYRIAFDKNRELNEKEKIVVQEFMGNVRTALLASQGSKSKSLAILREYTQALESKKDEFSPAMLSRMHILLSTMITNINRTGEEDLKSMAGDWIRGLSGVLGGKKTEEIRTRENSQKAIDEANEKTRVTGEMYIAHWNGEKFEIIGLNTIGNIIRSDIRNMNAAVFRSLFEGNDIGWKYVAEKLDTMSRSAIGAYLENNPNTRLFQGVPSFVKEFFLGSYRETLIEQTRIAKEKNINGFTGKFEELFPNVLAKYEPLKSDTLLQKTLQEGRNGDFYNELVKRGINNGVISKIMEAVNGDLNNIRTVSKKESLDQSTQWKGKTIEMVKGEFNFGEKDKEFFEKIKGRRIEINNLSTEERKILLLLIKPESTLKKFFGSIQTYENAAKGGATAHFIWKETGKKPPLEKAKALDEKANLQMHNGENLGLFQAQQELHKLLVQKNKSSGDKELHRQIEDQKREDSFRVASAVVTYLETPGLDKKDAREFITGILPPDYPQKDVGRWIEGQVFLHTYVHEKNFVDSTELRAAYMDIPDTKSFSEVAWGTEKISIDNIPSGSSIRIGETTLSNTSFSGISELMNCSIVSGRDNVFCRNIVSPQGEVILKDVPLKTLEPAIEQLSRYYVLGIGILAPYMETISNTINRVRSESVSGLDRDYTQNEDTLFLKVFTALIYGKDAIPEEQTPNNYLRIFNSPDTKNDPMRRLKGLGVVREDGSGVNTTQLKSLLKKASISA